MIILLPLVLIGFGYLVYLLFAAATYVLPLYAGLAVGFAAFHGGASGMGALLLGFIAFVTVTALGQIATQMLPSRTARTAVTLLFAVPAATAGFAVATGLLHLGGIGSWGVVVALVAAIVTGTMTAKRLQTPPQG